MHLHSSGCRLDWRQNQGWSRRRRGSQSPPMPFLLLSSSVVWEVTSSHLHTAIERFSRERRTEMAVKVKPQGWLSTWVVFLTEPRGWGSPHRVTRTFFLGCIARRRPSNWLHRRFYRAVLPRPLETPKGVPDGRIGMAEGGRAALTWLAENTTCLLSFRVYVF